MTLLKNENLTTNFEPTEYSDVINKFYLDEKFEKIDAHTSFNKKTTTNSSYNTSNNL